MREATTATTTRRNGRPRPVALERPIGTRRWLYVHPPKLPNVKRRAYLAGVGSLATATALSGCIVGPRFGPGNDAPGVPVSEENEAYGDAFARGAPWPHRCHDVSRSGHNPDTSPPVGDVGTAWLRTAMDGRLTADTTAPVTDDTRVFVGAGRGDGSRGVDGFVAALDGESGTREWRSTVVPGRIGGLAYHDGTVFVLGQGTEPRRATVTALSATDGTERWHIRVGDYIEGGLTVAGEHVVAVTREPGVTALTLDGHRAWTQTVTDDDRHPSGTPCATGSALYVGTDEGHVVALDPTDGHLLWERDVVRTGHHPRIQTVLTVADDTLYVTGTDSYLSALDVAEGTRRWTSRYVYGDHSGVYSSPTVVGDRVYVNTENDGIIAVRRDDGTEVWRTGEGGTIRPPAAAGDLVVAPDGNGVRAFDAASGDDRWTVEIPKPDDATDGTGGGYRLDPEVALAHDRAYVTVHDGRVFSLGAK